MFNFFLKYKYLTLIIIFSVISVLPLLHKGFPPTHDGEYHVIRFYEFDKVLRSGNFYPRWAPDLNNGYGVPLFNYVYPFPNYFGSFLHSFNISFIDAFKLNMFFATIIGSIFFFLWAKESWGDLGGFVSAVFYTFSPYHFVDIYIRGSVGEVWALAFFPMLLFLINKISKDQNIKYIPFAGLSFGLLIFSHNILALMFISFLVFYTTFLLYKSNSKKTLFTNVALVFFIGLSFSSIFWMPALFEKGYVTGLQIYNVKENFPEIFQLIIPSWGSGFSGGTLENQMSFQIGIANLLVIFGTLVFFPVFLKKRVNSPIITFFLISFVFTLLLMLRQSLFLWEKIPLLDYFQFPWRILSLTTLITSFLAGAFLTIWKSKILAFLMVIIVFVLGVGYAKPAYYNDRDDNYYVSRSNFIDGTNSTGNYFNTIWFDNNLKKQNVKFQSAVLSNDLQVISNGDYKFGIKATKEQELVTNIAYFPQWSVSVDGKDTVVRKTKNGLFLFKIRKGEHLVNIKLKDTLVRKTSILLFFVSIIVILLLFIKFSYAKIKK